jgi:hypothetical protein
LTVKPIFSTCRIKSAGDTDWGSKATEACSVAKLTLASLTPGSFLRPRVMFMAQLAQVMPVIGRMTVRDVMAGPDN